jgi:anti-sigma factor RsiW
MDCLHERAPSDEELISFALDEETLRQEVQSHLEQCETCQRRLARYQNVNASLLSRFYRFQCPTGTELSYYSAGGLSPEKRLRIAEHILDCPLCKVEVEESRHFLQAPLFEFPLSSSAPHGLVRRIFAALVKQPQMQFALRDDAPEMAWPRQYQAEVIDLSLHLSRASSGEHMLFGILTDTSPAAEVEALEGVPAELYAAPWPSSDESTVTPLLRTQVDDLGNIVFKPVSAGEYTMVIRLPDREIVIEGLLIEHGI